jgi:hypothetical protein
MQRLARSSRFWTLILDVVVSITLFFVGKYAGAALEDTKFLIVTLQPVFVLLIGAYTAEDMAAKSAAKPPAGPAE